jgi:hypothetical protein
MGMGQLIGIVIGGLIGYAVAASIAGGKYRFIGGNMFEVTREPKGFLPGCLITLILTALGAGAGFVVGGMFGG